MLYLSHHAVDIACIQGTRWHLTKDWSTHGYWALSAGTEDRRDHGGLLTLVHHRLCGQQDLSSSSPIPGRVQHVKCRLAQTTLEIVQVYQYTTEVTSTRAKPFDSRAEVWSSLDTILTHLPIRNVLVVAGDFNTDLHKQPHEPQDAWELRELCRKHTLATVRPYDHAHTFEGPGGKSTIDHVLMRRCQQDSQVKHSRVFQSFPVAGWRALRDHMPILSSLPAHWKVWRKLPTTRNRRWTWHQRQDLQMHYRAQDDAWQEFVPQAQARLHVQHPTWSTLEQVSQWSHDYWIPTCPPCRTEPDWRHPASHRYAATMWSHYHQLRRLVVTDLRSSFQAWTHAAIHSRLHKAMTVHAHRQKQDRFQEQMHRAAQADRAHDQRQLHMIVRELSPKQPSRPIRFRTATGLALSPEVELDLLRQHFETVYCGSTPQMPGPSARLSSMPFTADDLRYNLARVPLTKAVAPGSLQPAVVRCLADDLAQICHQLLVREWCHRKVTIPQHWQAAWLTLIAKRAVQTPKDVRPIALTDVLGKCVLQTLMQKVRPHVLPSLCQAPLLGYLPNRSTIDALIAVFHHCRDVRARSQSAMKNLWQRRAGEAPRRIGGGLCLSLDLSEAFDRMPRERLGPGLDQVNCPPDLKVLLLAWLHGAAYHIDHRGQSCQLVPTRGTRQGCVASPLQWNVCLLDILMQFLASIDQPLEWLRAHLISYADDLVLKWEFDHLEDLPRALIDIGHLLDVLEANQLVVNLRKTACLLRMSGSKVAGLFKRWTKHNKGGRYLIVPRQQGDCLIPWVSQHTYLGTKISYGPFEMQTLKHRIHVGRLTYTRLRAFFQRRHAFSLGSRVRLWTSCVRASYVYGLAASGMTSKGVDLLETVCTTDLRRIARSPSYITRETTEALRSRLGVPSIRDFLRDAWTRFRVDRTGLLSTLAPDDFLHTLPYASHCDIVLEALAPKQPVDAEAPPVSWQCPHCSTCMPSHMTLMQHITRNHPAQKMAPQPFRIFRDAAGDMPQCRHCGGQFQLWSGLVKHISLGRCLKFDAALQDRPCPADDPELRQAARQQDWLGAVSVPQLLDLIRNKCILCAQWQPSGKAIHEHLSRMHHKVWHAAQAFLSPIARAVTTRRPCIGCGNNIVSTPVRRPVNWP